MNPRAKEEQEYILLKYDICTVIRVEDFRHFRHDGEQNVIQSLENTRFE